MLTALGILTVVTLLALILFRVTSVLVALTLVPIVAALAGGFGTQIGAFAMEGIRGVTPIAALLAFAVVYFGVMNDAGLFDPLIRQLLRVAHRDPVRIAVGTAAVAAVAHLDGAGASTFMVTVPAMLPLYQRAGMSPLSLTCTTALAAGTMNMLPWGGPTNRAAVALQVGLTELFIPLLLPMLAGLAAVFALSAHIGMWERKRLRSLRNAEDGADADAEMRTETSPAAAATRLTGRWYLNAVLTVVTLAALFGEVLPLAVVFIVASAIALLVNYPDAHAQRERLTVHGSAAMMMVTTVFAAGVFTGILTKSGMLGAVSADLVRVLPDAVLRHLPVLVGLTSMPLSLAFDPDSFYFGLLPVLARSSEAAGGSAIETARAALLGQMTTGFPVSPLTPATFLLVGLAGVDLADHQRRTIPYAFAVTVIMTVAALATGALRW
ncbi:MAG TPA: citrate:proton symporter [Vicinamibacterales bacterium]|jgi:CitMHS family citrate-Mg2+:H+ or citrate-Ca2+:H+ symporter|nr:citrate:proton symporter [Vicinamibacterales bacterium]